MKMHLRRVRFVVGRQAMRFGAKTKSNLLENLLVVSEMAEVEDAPDLVSPMTADEYYNQRFMPLFKLFKRQRKSLALFRRNTLLACIAMSALGTFLAAYHNAPWIPVSVGLGTFFVFLQDSKASPQLVNAMNQAHTNLAQMEISWQSSSIFQQRGFKMKQKLVVTTENSAKLVADAMVAQVLLDGGGKKGGMHEEDEEEPAEKKDDAKTAKTK